MRLARDQTGAVFVEATVTMLGFLVFILGSIDFLYAFYQLNAAVKALQIGARIAAVSDPVADGLVSLGIAAETIATLGSNVPLFTVRCDGGTENCACAGLANAASAPYISPQR